MGSIPTFFSNRYKGFCLHGPHALALWWLFPFVELTGGSPRVHIYISCSPWRHSLLLSRGRLALSGRKAGVRRVGMIATLAKDPLAFGSVHKRGRTPTDQFSGLARALAFPMGCLRSKPYTLNHFGRL